jgi:hypothetical protein
MKKHLVAFLSMIGLAGSAVPATSQVLKGSNQVSKTKAESQIKQNKQNAEKSAAAAQNKAAKTTLQNKATTNETSIKSGKTAAENNAAKNQSKLKLQQETLRNQNTAAGQKNALTKAGLTKAALTKAKGAEQK